jgi:hypothetical protein
MRGYQRKVIFLKDTGSHLFDEAYFVVSRKGEEASICKSDMIFEANRIIKESLTYREKRVKGIRSLLRLNILIPFSVGALASFLITTLIYFLLK